MARNRMIKPEFWKDDALSEVSPYTRLLYIALWNFSDDFGYLEYRLKKIKVECLPYDDIDIDKLLQELVNIDKIEISGGIIWLKNFTKHQRVDKPKPSDLSQRFKDSENDRRMIDERSTTKREDKTSEIEVKEKEISTNVDSAKDAQEDSEKIYSVLEDVSEPTPQVSRRPPSQYGNAEISKMLLALKKAIGIEAFADSVNERNIGRHLVNLCEKIGGEEFKRRLGYVLNDDFRRKNCNRIRYLYAEVKSAPVVTKPNII